MINTKDFYDFLVKNKIDLFAGVPDSLLSSFCSCIKENSKPNHNIITANEGNAIALAAGYHLSTGKFGCIYMQNSGLGNAINPLLSLVDKKVYSIPMLLVIGWRGEPKVHDEPQHIKQGEVTLELLETIGIKYLILNDNYVEQILQCVEYMKKENAPIALVVRKNTFSKYDFKPIVYNYELTREKALEIILSNIDNNDLIVSTTGKTSREIFEIREKKNQGHQNDFLTVGSMGHTASIAYGIALGTKKRVYCIDGDGSFIMHMGSLGVIGTKQLKNFKYILNNNGAHESVGGQDTCGFELNIKKILMGCGFKKVIIVENSRSLIEALNLIKNKNKMAIVINTRQGSRNDLGRPTTTPIENKISFMKELKRK
ncbi:MAG: phosphonopyruvate decarboxylase [Bacillales bacterium]|jgi:phosphonopyruvate decarboxylase|nr:phosphonopyruvate decarboxylase [Bacillales bacterium]